MVFSNTFCVPQPVPGRIPVAAHRDVGENIQILQMLKMMVVLSIMLLVGGPRRRCQWLMGGRRFMEKYVTVTNAFAGPRSNRIICSVAQYFSHTCTIFRHACTTLFINRHLK